MFKKAAHILVSLLIATQFVRAQSVADEYNLKAAFIYNFTKYIEWGNSEAKKEFIIGVLGPSTVIESLEEIAATKNVNGKKIVIKRFYSPDEISFSHILFVSRVNESAASEILARTVKGTLVISEKQGFAGQGVAINFIIVENKLKFEANKKAIDAAGLKASSQLLKLAILVEG